MPITINDGGVPQKITRMQQGDGFKRGLQVGALYLRGQLAYYPPVNRRPQAQFWSDETRRGFFAHLNAGDIEVPYRRSLSPGSERMAARWAIKSSRGGYTQTIGNNTSYANLVIGDRQTAYHREGGWQTVEDIAKDEELSVVDMVVSEIDKDMK